MSSTLSVHFLPSLVSPDELAGGTVVMIDVLRASTTIITALANGAKEVIPCLEVEEARRIAKQLHPGTAVLGGERKGGKIEGFDLGNSPSEYSRQVVEGKTIVMTTTNGTRALSDCGKANQVLVGAFVNFNRLLDELNYSEAPIHLLCAGTDGAVTREDVLFAGTIAAHLMERGRRKPWVLNDSARIAVDAIQADFGREPFGPDPARVENDLRQTRGGANLLGMGLAEDIAAAAAVNGTDIVPIWLKENRIVDILTTRGSDSLRHAGEPTEGAQNGASATPTAAELQRDANSTSMPRP